MKVYLIADITITDSEGYEEYRDRVGDTVQKHGGKFVAVTHRLIETLEGDWQPSHIVIVEFESLEQAKKWYSSPEYTLLIEIRARTSGGSLVLME